ncbi:MAG: tRNA1(Val) (adenine(37)-N6)-methyltransferase [Lachnospiraceae bacterium]|nr:tRNA1(Val) (adenine(37)-N6)-methyltransferase [Lachnospiraceae bacterium]
MELREGERIDELQRNGYRIIQKKDGFCFGMDAVLLSGFARAGKGAKVLDLGTGTGIIPILLRAKTEAAQIKALEIQPEVAEMATRSVVLNGLEDTIEIVQGDICQASQIFGAAQFDVVTSNPPYKLSGHGLPNPDSAKAIARHEVLCTFEDVAREAAKCLKPGGHFYLVHRPERLTELIAMMQKYGLEPKRMKFVHPFVDKEANMVLVDAVRGGKPYLHMEAPIVVYKEPGIYTDEIYEIYGY